MRSLTALLVAMLVAGCPVVAADISHPALDVVEYRVDPMVDGWRFPELRTTYRAFMRPTAEDALARAGEALREGDVPMACALLLSAQRGGHVDADDPVAEAVRMAAVEALARRDIPWGAQPLLTLVANPAMNPSTRAMAETLLDQLEPDDVKGNAYASCELYLVGLQEDWDTWLTVLLDRCARRVKTPGAEWGAWDQPQTLLTSLAMLAAMHGPDGLRDARESWWFLAYGRGQARFAGFRKASNAQRRALLDLAHKWHNGHAVREGEYEIHAGRGNRLIAWWMLEGMFPESAPVLRTIAMDDSVWWYHRRRALAVFLVHDPELLVRSGGPAILPEVVASYNGHWFWPTARLGEFFRGPVPEEVGADCYIPSLQDIIDYEPAWEKAAFAAVTVAPHRDVLLRQVREQLARESDPDRQLNLAAFLNWANDPKANELIGTTIISNLVDDDVFGNRERARWLIRGPEENDAMHAALNLGMEMRDWQLVTDAAEHLLIHDDKRLLDTRPDVALFILDQMGDDEVKGNASAAVRVLFAAGPDSAQRVFQRREPKDEHETQLREWVTQRLKENENWGASSSGCFQ